MINKLGKNIPKHVCDLIKENGLSFDANGIGEVKYLSLTYLFVKTGVKGSWDRVEWKGVSE